MVTQSSAIARPDGKAGVDGDNHPDDLPDLAFDSDDEDEVMLKPRPDVAIATGKWGGVAYIYSYTCMCD
jgi:hypothetical protein